MKQQEHYPTEATELLEKYFEKGDPRRGEALAIMAIAFHEGRMDASLKEEIEKISKRRKQ